MAAWATWLDRTSSMCSDPCDSSMSANNIPPISEMRLSKRRMCLRVWLLSSASIIASAPSSPILQEPRSSRCNVVFTASTPAMLTATSSPRGLSLRTRLCNARFVHSVSAHARPPYSVRLLEEQLQVTSPAFASRAFASAIAPLSRMSHAARSSAWREVLRSMAAAREDVPPGPIRLCESESDVSVVFAASARPATTPTSGPPPLYERSSV
mmetsp:Transcript_26653/g.63697  ORF Transcript_26653/g.63697 Transcript_26653/m.63697 type:complete len:211 (-) Transcript_26653:357-989(-)